MLPSYFPATPKNTAEKEPLTTSRPDEWPGATAHLQEQHSMGNIYGYIRVSSTEQNEDRQIQALKKAP